MTFSVVSEMTYNVSSGTLNTTIPHHTMTFSAATWKKVVNSPFTIHYYHMLHHTIFTSHGNIVANTVISITGKPTRPTRIYLRPPVTLTCKPSS